MKTTRVILPNAVLLGEVSRFLADGRSVVIKTKGSSMSPFIRGGRDSVELLKMPSAEVGDIVLCLIAPGRYVLHRIHAIDGDAVTLKGDGNLDATESCTVSDICGTVTAILRPGGRRLDCRSEGFRRKSRLWVSAPRIVRRYCLGIYRRIKFL